MGLEFDHNRAEANLCGGEKPKNLGECDPPIKNHDITEYGEVSNNDNILIKEVSKSTFFQSINYLQNLALD